MLPPVYVSYSTEEGRGALRRGDGVTDGVWIRLRTAAVEIEAGAIETPDLLSLSWPGVLSIVRQFSGLQRDLDFKFSVEQSAREKIAQFAAEHRLVEAARGKVT